MSQIKDGDRFSGPEGEIYEIRGLAFQCYDQTYYPAAEMDRSGGDIEVANWPESFFLYECRRIGVQPGSCYFEDEGNFRGLE